MTVHDGVSFTLTNPDPDGQDIVVTIDGGDPSGSVTVPIGPEDIDDDTDGFANSIASVSGDSEFENLTTTGTTGVDIDYGVLISDLTPELEGGDVTVDEDDLLATRGVDESDGSDHSPESTTQQGTFTINAPDGIDDLTIGGNAVITNGTFAVTSFTTGLGNTLSITGFNSVTGEITYTYELVDDEDHSGAGDDDELFENFTVVLTDTDNDSDTGTLSVRIVDDVPVGIFAETVHLENVVNLEESFTLNFVAGADGIATVDFNFGEGDPAFDANGAQLKLNDEELFLFFGDDGGGGGDKTVLIARTLASASVETTTAGTGSTNEVQTLTVDGAGGTYTLDFGAETTAAIAPDATAGEVEAALEALAGISGVSVLLAVVDGSNVYTITFDNTGNVAPLVVDATALEGDVAFTIDIDSTTMTGTYSFASNGVISNSTEVDATNLSGVGGGNTNFKALLDLDGTLQDVMMTTASDESVNTNNTQIGIGSGQSFADGDGIRFDLVNNLVVTENTGQTPDTFAYDGTHNETNLFRQSTFYTSGATSVTFILSAFLADPDGLFYNDPDDPPVSLDVGDINIFTTAATAEDPLAVGTDVTNLVSTSDNGDGTVTVTVSKSDAGDGFWYQIETDATDPFSAVQIDSDGAGKFKLGFFTYGVDDPGDPIDMSYDIIGTDGDGDQVAGTIDAKLYPDAVTTAGTDGTDSLTGTDVVDDVLLGLDGNDTLSGLGGDDTLVGGTGDDTLFGGDDNDVLFGGDDNDVLFGGAGNDILTGDAGADRFVIEGSDINVPTNVAGDFDTITDFETGADTLDLSDIFADAGVTAVEGSHHEFKDSGGGDTEVRIDTTGSGDFSGDAVVVLTGITAVDLNGTNVDV